MPSALEIVKRRYPNVTKVVDAKIPVKVEVTAKDTFEGKTKKHQECALAQAAKRKFHLDGVMVSLKSTYLIKGTKATRFVTSESAAREIVSFDRHQDFEKGVYQLSPPSPASKLGSRKGRKQTENRERNSKNIQQKRFMHFTGNVRDRLA